MKIELPYGSERLTLPEPSKGSLDFVHPKSMEQKDALPIDFLNNQLPRLLADAASIMVLLEISDAMFPIDMFLEGLSKIVQTSGVPKDSVQVVMSFRPGLENFVRTQKRKIAFNSHIHDPNNDECTHIGTTVTSDIPLEIRCDFVEADYTFGFSTIIPDHVMTATGNMSILPGIASKTSIENYYRSHIYDIGAFTINDPLCRIRMEAIQLSELDYQFTCVQDFQGNIINLSQGKPESAWNESLVIAERIAKTHMKRRYDAAIVAPGSNRDLTLFSSINALCVGSMVTRQNGSILLVADCSGGLGHTGFSKGVLMSFSDLKKTLEDSFQLGMKRAVLFHKILETRRVFILSKHLDGDFHINTKCTIIRRPDEAMTLLSNDASSLVAIPEADWIDPFYV